MSTISKVSKSTMDVRVMAFFVAVSVITLLVSYMASARLYADNQLIPFGVLVVMGFILLESFVAVYFSTLSRFASSIFGKPGTDVAKAQEEPVGVQTETMRDQAETDVPPAEAWTDGKAACEKPTEAFEKHITTVGAQCGTDTPLQSAEEPQEMAGKSPVTDAPTASVKADQEEDEKLKEIYEQSVADSHAEAESFGLKRKKMIRKYLYWALAPILEEENMLAFWHEIEQWIDKPTYTPAGRDWKWKQFKPGYEVKHIDMRHLIWNIGKRLGMSKGYSTRTCALFVQAMFPDLCKNVQLKTLTQCLTADPLSGHIRLDTPEGNSIAFHYERNPKMEQAAAEPTA